jgi:hypothetical protein
VTILLSARTGPEDAVLGWSISQNSTGQTLRAFTRDDGTGKAWCTEGFVPAQGFVPGFNLCGGGAVAGALFPAAARAFSLAGTAAGVFFQPENGATLSLLAGAPTCDALTLETPESPFGTGAFVASFESGQPAAPPSAWAELPSWCPT